MPWPWQSGTTSKKGDDDKPSILPSSIAPSSSKNSVSWNDTLNVKDWDHYKDPRSWIPAFVLTTVLFCGIKFYKTYLRPIRSIEYLHPGLYRKHTLFGRVTSVGDGDGYHLFHTPGGRWAGWGWLRKIPDDKKALKGNTISIRIAGIDAPEGAHFGRPAQPHSAEALEWLQSTILHKPVRAHIYRRDQYDRVVATTYMKRLLFFRRDIGLEMLRRGLATTYEAKSGVEFGGPEMEAAYRAAETEAKAKNLGLWAALKSEGKGKGWFRLEKAKKEVNKAPFETPRQFKTRMRELDKSEKGEAR